MAAKTLEEAKELILAAVARARALGYVIEKNTYVEVDTAAPRAACCALGAAVAPEPTFDIEIEDLESDIFTWAQETLGWNPRQVTSFIHGFDETPNRDRVMPDLRPLYDLGVEIRKEIGL